MKIEHQVWQKVPGTKGLKLYPYIRKVDINSSNSYLISSERFIILIDPGGLEPQTEVLLEEIARLREENDRPVLVCLTHIHLDHCRELLFNPRLRALPRMAVAVQDSGAEALALKNRAATIADMLHVELPDGVSVDIRLVISEEGDREYAMCGERIITCCDPVILENDDSFPRQVLPLGGGDTLEFFHTPGHSPDSVCIRAGEFFIIGDLLFGTAPVIAGIYGWSAGELVTSIDRVTGFIAQGGVTTFLPGHGNALDTPTMIRALSGMRRETMSLSGIDMIDAEWVSETAGYGQELMAEVERLFTVIAGRLVYVAHVLDEIEESGEADRLRGLINADLVDELIADFNSFSRDLHEGNIAELHLALKAGQIVSKLNRIYQEETLSEVLDLSLARRAGRLLEDYGARFRGYRPRTTLIPADLNEVLEAVLTELSGPAYGEEDILDVEDEAQFVRALVVRIASVNIFEGVSLRFTPAPGMIPAEMDRERFGETMAYLLEKLVSSGMKSVTFTSALLPEGGELRAAWTGGSALGPTPLRFGTRLAGLAGARLEVEPCPEGGMFRMIFHAPPL
ncbi:glyoxylase-like metal-dependent hydrolase (beta-lactamase superfamily II) [Methanolinea mesophila]|uniref:MBL fold metallo-hydrolase n=1 Tax=Methanolinea mesophila TaxID=547055 RepID=UPI001AE86D1E|nr:MBL fold metallo-hydrolase [Methanolinea mesophila]MBP1928857.1 glyoxylase-like metal-dependent hydrolase (beta-lactamase superfamily II) [Methanolinea mesophila]